MVNLTPQRLTPQRPLLISYYIRVLKNFYWEVIAPIFGELQQREAYKKDVVIKKVLGVNQGPFLDLCLAIYYFTIEIFLANLKSPLWSCIRYKPEGKSETFISIAFLKVCLETTCPLAVIVRFQSELSASN